MVVLPIIENANVFFDGVHFLGDEWDLEILMFLWILPPFCGSLMALAGALLFLLAKILADYCSCLHAHFYDLIIFIFGEGIVQ